MSVIDIIKAGTYSGHKLQDRTKFQGMDISVENKKGSFRHWKDRDGNSGKTKMIYPYGYIRGTEGSDGDHVDCYIGPDENCETAFIIHQHWPDTGKYDEDKVMLGFNSPDEAKKAYLAHYDNPKFFGSMTEMPMDKFKEKAYNTLHGKTKVIKARDLSKLTKKVITNKKGRKQTVWVKIAELKSEKKKKGSPEKKGPAGINSPEFKSWFGNWEKGEGSKVTKRDGSPEDLHGIVGRDGNPIKLHHGTGKKFTEFDIKQLGSASGDAGWFGAGFYFTQSEISAGHYARDAMMAMDKESTETVITAYINIRKPFTITKKVDSVDSIFEKFMEMDMPEVLRKRIVLEKSEIPDWPVTHGIVQLIAKIGSDTWTKILKENGHDGVIFRPKPSDIGLDVSEVIAFEPNQIKSTDATEFNSSSNNIYKASLIGIIIKNTLQKGRDLSKLTKKVIQNKLGKRQTVWVSKDQLGLFDKPAKKEKPGSPDKKGAKLGQGNYSDVFDYGTDQVIKIANNKHPVNRQPMSLKEANFHLNTEIKVFEAAKGIDIFDANMKSFEHDGKVHIIKDKLDPLQDELSYNAIGKISKDELIKVADDLYEFLDKKNYRPSDNVQIGRSTDGKIKILDAGGFREVDQKEKENTTAYGATAYLKDMLDLLGKQFGFEYGQALPTKYLQDEYATRKQYYDESIKKDLEDGVPLKQAEKGFAGIHKEIMDRASKELKLRGKMNKASLIDLIKLNALIKAGMGDKTANEVINYVRANNMRFADEMQPSGYKDHLRFRNYEVEPFYSLDSSGEISDFSIRIMNPDSGSPQRLNNQVSIWEWNSTWMNKARDLSKLTKKVIQNKLGKRQTVWVKVAETKSEKKKKVSPEKETGKHSPEFKKWFGNSKVVKANGDPAENYPVSKVADKDGKAITVYHGTAAGGFEEFTKDKQNARAIYGSGFYFTEDKGIATEYKEKGKAGAVVDLPEYHKALEAWAEQKGPDMVEGFKQGLSDMAGVIKIGENKKYDFKVVRAGLVKYIQKKTNWKFHDISTPEQHKMLSDMQSEIEGIQNKISEKKQGLYEVYLNIRKPFDGDKGVIDISSLYKHIENTESKDIANAFKQAVGKKDNETTNYRELTEKLDGFYEETPADAINDYLKSQGHDGITHIGGRILGQRDHKVWIAFEPNQIKSTEAKDFDLSSNNIYKANLIDIVKYNSKRRIA